MLEACRLKFSGRCSGGTASASSCVSWLSWPLLASPSAGNENVEGWDWGLPFRVFGLYAQIATGAPRRDGVTKLTSPFFSEAAEKHGVCSGAPKEFHSSTVFSLCQRVLDRPPQVELRAGLRLPSARASADTRLSGPVGVPRIVGRVPRILRRFDLHRLRVVSHCNIDKWRPALERELLVSDVSRYSRSQPRLFPRLSALHALVRPNHKHSATRPRRVAGTPA
jgi:hypothetical protein